MVFAFNSSLSSYSEAARTSFSNIHYFTHSRKHRVQSTQQETLSWALKLDRFALAAEGGERSALNILESFLFSFTLGLRFGWGVGGLCLV
jgi:hypothetical protein